MTYFFGILASDRSPAMAVAKLTKTLVDGLAKGGLVWDTEVIGLGVRRQTTNARHYVLRYPIPQRGKTKQRIMSIGRHGSPLTVDGARTEAKRLLGRVADGRDPLIEKQAAKAPKPIEKTFGEAVEDYIAAKTKIWKPGTAVNNAHLLRNLAKPLHPLLAEIDRRRVAELLGNVEANNGPFARNRLRNSISAMFTWLIAEGRLPDGFVNPATGTATAEEGPSRDRVLTQAELVEVWRALPEDRFGDVLRLLILTGQRRNEIGKLQWSEIDFDKALIVLPPARTKNKRTHELPVAPQALAILRAQRGEFNGPTHDVPNDGPVFGFIDWAKHKTRLDAAMSANRVPKAKPMPHWTLHDLRRTCATGLAGLGVLPHVIECVLNHLSGFRSGVAGTYNRNRYEAEMRAALELWGNHVDGITGKPKARAA
jgi:integrase